LPLSFVSLFLNLQEIKFSSDGSFKDFRELQHITFPKLQILKIPFEHPKTEYMIKFLENNGKNLQEFYMCERNKAFNLSIAKYCPNLKKLFTMFYDNELDTLKAILNSCRDLEGIITWYSSQEEFLETIAKHSPKNFYELKLHEPYILPEYLESFFINWGRLSKKSLSLIFIDYHEIEENMKIIEKYKNLGIIKNFEIRDFEEEELYL
jgi:hypothetical protein